jgi:hypothetical protein
MEIKAKTKTLFGTKKTQVGGPLQEVMITISTKKEKRIHLCFKGNQSSGIVTLNESELRKIKEAL